MQTNVAPAAGAPPFVNARFVIDNVVRSEKAVTPEGTDAFEFVMSDASVDRMGDVIEPDGWQLDAFMQNPIALFGHKTDNVIGKWSNVQVSKGKLLGRLDLATRGSALIEYVRALVEQKILRAVSVGFRPIKYEPLDDKADDWFGPFRFIEQELLECSLVAVPANPNALSTAKSLHLPREVIAEIFRKPAPEDRPVTLTHHRKPANALVPIGAKTMLTRGQRIEQTQHALVTMRDRLEALDAMETRSDADETEYTDLPPKIEATAASLAQMEAAEKALTGKVARSLPAAGRITLPAQARGQIEKPRDLIYRSAVTFFIAKTLGKTVDDVLKERYPGDENLGMIVKAAMAPAQTTVAGWAAELGNIAVLDFLNILARIAIYPKLAARGPRFTFGNATSVRIPARSNTPKINGSFVGEGQPIPVRKLGLTSITLTPKKMAVISEFTREMAMHSTPSIESVIRQAMDEDTAEAIDTVLIDNVAADAVRPAGLLFGLTTLTPAAAGTSFEKMIADIKALIAPIAAARGGRDLVLIMNTAQALAMSWAVTPLGEFVFSSVDQGVVRNITVVASTTVQAARLILVDAADSASATGDSPAYDVSEVATIHEEDTAPLPIVGGVAQPPLIASVAAPVRSLWQTASIGIRMLLDMNWAMRRPSMVTFMDGVTW